MRLWRALGTEWLLEQWGLWARMTQANLGYPKASNFVDFQGGSIKTPEIQEDMALAVDRIVKLSALIEPNYEIALCARFVRKRTQVQMSKDLHTSRTEAVQILNRAEAWVDGYLHSVAHDLEMVGKIDHEDPSDAA